MEIRITVECFENSMIYSCTAEYGSKGITLVQSEEVDNHTKKMASDALLVTSSLLSTQIEDNNSKNKGNER